MQYKVTTVPSTFLLHLLPKEGTRHNKKHVNMKKLLTRLFIMSVFCVITFTNGFSQETELIQLDENIYLHPAKNALELRISRDDLLNQALAK